MLKYLYKNYKNVKSNTELMVQKSAISFCQKFYTGCEIYFQLDIAHNGTKYQKVTLFVSALFYCLFLIFFNFKYVILLVTWIYFHYR